MNHILKRMMGTALAVTALGLGLTAQVPPEKIEKTFRLDASKPMEIEFRDVDGRLRLSASPDTTVSVKVTKEVRIGDAKRAERLLQETRVEIEQQGNRVLVRIRYPRFRGFFFWLTDSARVRVASEITVPAGARLTADLVDGSVVGEGLSGDFAFDVTDGDIRLSGIKGTLEASAVDGTIDVAGEFHGLTATSVDGDIRIESAPGSTTAHAWEIRTVDGDVDLALPAGFSANLNVHTSDGRLTSAFSLSEEKTVGRKRYTASLGEGGKTLSVRTTDGDITLRKR